jgi:hypothetical protein
MKSVVSGLLSIGSEFMSLDTGYWFLVSGSWLLVGTEAPLGGGVACNWSSVGQASTWCGEALAKTGARRDIPKAKETLSPRISNTEGP